MQETGERETEPSVGNIRDARPPPDHLDKKAGGRTFGVLRDKLMGMNLRCATTVYILKFPLIRKLLTFDNVIIDSQVLMMMALKEDE